MTSCGGSPKLVAMNAGQVSWALASSLLGLVALGCGSTDSDAGTPQPKMGAATADCGTVQEPLELTIKDVQPAANSTVSNSNIVQSFTIAGKLLKIPPSFAFAAAHTAGASVPAIVRWTYAGSGADTVYTSQPVSWTNAGHVELNPPGLLVTPDGCVSVLPTPTFSYDVTAP